MTVPPMLISKNDGCKVFIVGG